MEINYKKEIEESLSISLKLSNKLKDLLCYSDKRTKNYKKLKEMIFYLNEFEKFNYDKKIDFNCKKTFDIKIDIKVFENLKFIQEQTKKDTLTETLNYFTNKFRNTFIRENFINIDDLENITKDENKNISNSIYSEKYSKQHEAKFLFSIDDIKIEDNNKYLNLYNFYFFDQEVNIPIYVSDNLTFKELKSFYEI